jgi:hypothetical protein
MSAKKNHLTPLEVRKQMLLAESELNRVQFIHEWSDLKSELHRLTGPLRTVGAVASSVARVGATFSLLRRFWTRGEPKEKKSWVSMLLDGAKTGASLWLMLRSRKR